MIWARRKQANIMSRGQWYRHDTKTAVEHCQRLDIRELKLKSGSCVNITYSTYSHSGERQTINKDIPVTWTPCHLGGKRAWWLCPCCGKRVAILYLLTTGYRCRKCHNLTYWSSQESKFDRHLRKKFKLCDKLGIGPIDWPLFKPKFMHQKTFDRLRWKHTLAVKTTTTDLAVEYKHLIGRNIETHHK